eukprot:TRINITY_DN67193_c0_g1_i1.p1 TRINITY_DN67193_c0_g1~~TRINITY_DN67193_c0_g1_i1.p1  ORF type:complete len:438 (-),score=57.67 TRINITY_DN67193_c0_g1_i1:257-1570(-)
MDKTVKPDGGLLAWIIVAASFMISALQDGFMYGFGVLVPSISQQLGVGRGPAAGVSSIMMFTAMTFGGPLGALSVRKFGHRVTSIMGSFLAALGLLLAGLYLLYCDGVPAIAFLYVLIGGVTGIGFGLMYLPAFDIIEHYFDKHLAVATGIASAGTGLGTFGMAPLLQYLEASFGLAWLLLVVSGIMATGVIFSLPYTPLALDHKDEKQSSWQKTKVAYTNIFTSIPMIILLFIHFIMCPAGDSFFALASDRAEEKFGISAEGASFVLGIAGVANIFGKILFGLVLDHFPSHAFQSTLVACLVFSSSVMLTDQVPTFYGQAFCSVLFGFSYGCYDVSILPLVQKVTPCVTEGFGLAKSASGISSLWGPIVVGLMYDEFKSYTPGFAFIVSLAFIASFLTPVAGMKRLQKNPDQETSQDITDQENSQDITGVNNLAIE